MCLPTNVASNSVSYLALASWTSGLDSTFPSTKSHLITTILLESFSVGRGQMTLGRADMRIRLCWRRLIKRWGLTHPTSPPWLPFSPPPLTGPANPPTAGAWSPIEGRGLSLPVRSRLIASGQILQGWRGMKSYVEPPPARDSLTLPSTQEPTHQFQSGRLGDRFCALPMGKQAGENSPTS